MITNTVPKKIEVSSYQRLYCDGACRGNPGKSAIGAVLWEEKTDELLFELSKYIGHATNNVAEYTALIMGLEKALSLGVKHLEVFLDSELVVRQLNGVYAIKNPRMRPLYQKANRLLKQLTDYKIHHIPRHENQHADSLANHALDSHG